MGMASAKTARRRARSGAGRSSARGRIQEASARADRRRRSIFGGPLLGLGPGLAAGAFGGVLGGVWALGDA